MIERRDIPGFEGFYQADADGHIWSCARIVASARHKSGWKRVRERCLRGTFSQGYLIVQLYGAGKHKKAKIHHLVAQAFHGPRPASAECVRHLDDCRTNNRPTNLAYGTIAQNVSDSINNGTFTRGERNGAAKLLHIQVAAIKSRLRNGESTKALATEFGVAQSTICDIKAGRNWAHVDPAEAA